MYYHFQTLFKFQYQRFLFSVTMVDQCDKPVNFIFVEDNHERKSWKLFERHVKDLLEFFFVPVFCCSFDASMCNRSIIISTTCEETTVWVAILLSTVGYILPSPKL